MNDLQKCQLEILKEFIRVCTKHHLQYYLVGGTCLGAVRHQGFIPWDDDIDVAMPRKDYDLFITMQDQMKPPYFIQTYRSDPNYIYNYAKVRDSSTTFIENYFACHQINHGVWIDVFPLDGISERDEAYAKFKRKIRNLGQHIDIVAGLYDDHFLEERRCKAAHLYDKTLMFAVPIRHPLSEKTKIGVDDLKGKKVMMIRKGWNEFIDALREELLANGVVIEDFSMFSIAAFNQAVKENIPIITVEGWEDVHPLLKIVPADWNYAIPFGIFYSPTPSSQVRTFIDTVRRIAGK